MSESKPYGYVVELWSHHVTFREPNLLTRSRFLPRLQTAEDCAAEWRERYAHNLHWIIKIVPLYTKESD